MAPKPMIKVAHVVTSYRSATTILAGKLNALGGYADLEVSVVTGLPPQDTAPSELQVRHLTVPLIRPIRPPRDLLALWSLYRLFKRERFDVVHSHTAKAGFLTALAGRAAGIPLILHTYHGLPFYEGQSRVAYRTYRALESIACRFRHHVFSQNWEDLPPCAALMRSDARISYEGNGVDAADVERRAAQHRRRAESEFSSTGLRIALISRLEPVKRVDTFLQVCKLLRAMNVSFSAVVAGSGPLQAPLSGRLRELGLTSMVRILGWAPHAVALMAVSDVVVLTSEKEGIPRALMEAMALSKPVVATDVPGTRELVVHGQTGYLTPLGDERAMAQRVAALAEDPRLGERLGHAGRMRVESEYNDAKIAAFLRDFYLAYDGRQVPPAVIPAAAATRRASVAQSPPDRLA